MKDNPKVKFRIMPVGKTFFYQRPNGTVFACEEREASAIHDIYRQWGVSDSKSYRETMQDIFTKQDELTQEEAANKVRAAYEAEVQISKGKFEKPRDYSKEAYGGQIGEMTGFLNGQ